MPLGDRLPASFMRPGSSSFLEFLTEHAPHSLPSQSSAEPVTIETAQATTIIALTFAEGIILAGDRRATVGTRVAHRMMEKVFPADDFSAIGIAGTAGLAMDLVRLFQLELEHYEKIEGSLLSLEGKANRLATLVRSNLPLAMQGIAALPLFGGWDTSRSVGRIFSYDVVGGRYEEHDYHAIGSGAVYATGSLKKLWHGDLGRAEAIEVALHALVDAADDDAATAGPDALRGIYPIVAVVTGGGYVPVQDSELTQIATTIMENSGHLGGGQK